MEIGAPWSLAIMVNGHHHRIFLDNGSGVQVPVMSWSIGSRDGDVDFCSRCSWRSLFSPLHMRQLQDYWVWSVVSEKQLSISLNKQDHFELVL